MNASPEPSGGSRALRWASAVLGGITGLIVLLFFGSNGRVLLWIIPFIVIFLLIVLMIGNWLVPRLSRWLRPGIDFLVAAIASALLMAGIVAALVWSSFDTEYAPGYTEKAFIAVRLGDTYADVVALLGEPLTTCDAQPIVEWIYSAEPQPSFAQEGVSQGTYTTVTFDRNGGVKNVAGQRAVSANSIRIGDGENYLKLASTDIKLLLGKTQRDIRERFGSPAAIYEYKASTILQYSRSPSSSDYHYRSLGMDENGKVVHIWKSIYWD